MDNYRPTLPLAGRRVIEYEVVTMELKDDKHKPLPDTDYDEIMNILDPNAKKAANDSKKKSGATILASTNFLLLGLSFAVLSLKLQ